MGIVSTKHGYASAAMTRGDVSYPRYEVPLDALTPDVQLTPNRRPLFIGLGIVVVGVIVLLVVAFSGGPDEHAVARPADDDGVEQMPESNDVRTMPESPTPPPKAPPTDINDENMVSVVIHSDPPGADVLIAGTKIGVTPFESKLKRGTKITQLTVQKAGFAPFEGKIDLGGEYENRNIKLVPLDQVENADGSASEKGSGDAGDAEHGSGAEKPAPKDTPERTKTGPKVTPKFVPPRRDRDRDRPKEKEKDKEKCQPPGPNVDPFGPPVCKS
jgi:hypothetical protein